MKRETERMVDRQRCVQLDALSERAAGRDKAMALLDRLARTGPGGEGLMAIALRSLVMEGVLDSSGLWEAYVRAALIMGEERATRVFLGDGASVDVEGAIRAILDDARGSGEEREEETARQAAEMASRLGLDPDGVEVRMGEEGERRARAAGAMAVEQDQVIYLDQTRVDPRTKKGREILGHEVAHVGQMVGGKRSAAPEEAELEADLVGKALAAGTQPPIPQMALSHFAVAAKKQDSKTAQAHDAQKSRGDTEGSPGKDQEVGPDTVQEEEMETKQGATGLIYTFVRRDNAILTVKISGVIRPEVVGARVSAERKDSEDLQKERKQGGKGYVEKAEKGESDDVGHLIAWVLGGDSTTENLAPQRASLNRGGSWADLESVLKFAAENGHPIIIKMDIWWHKVAEGWRPNRVTLCYRVENRAPDQGVTTKGSKENQAGQNARNERSKNNQIKKGIEHRAPFGGTINIKWDQKGFSPQGPQRSIPATDDALTLPGTVSTSNAQSLFLTEGK